MNADLVAMTRRSLIAACTALPFARLWREALADTSPSRVGFQLLKWQRHEVVVTYKGRDVGTVANWLVVADSPHGLRAGETTTFHGPGKPLRCKVYTVGEPRCFMVPADAESDAFFGAAEWATG